VHRTHPHPNGAWQLDGCFSKRRLFSASALLMKFLSHLRHACVLRFSSENCAPSPKLCARSLWSHVVASGGVPLFFRNRRPTFGRPGLLFPSPTFRQTKPRQAPRSPLFSQRDLFSSKCVIFTTFLSRSTSPVLHQATTEGRPPARPPENLSFFDRNSHSILFVSVHRLLCLSSCLQPIPSTPRNLCCE